MTDPFPSLILPAGFWLATNTFPVPSPGKAEMVTTVGVTKLPSYVYPLVFHSVTLFTIDPQALHVDVYRPSIADRSSLWKASFDWLKKKVTNAVAPSAVLALAASGIRGSTTAVDGRVLLGGDEVEADDDVGIDERVGDIAADVVVGPGSGVDVVQPATARATTLRPTAYRPMARRFTP